MSVPMPPDHKKDLLVSFLSRTFDQQMHEMELHIVGRHGTRTVKILEVLDQMLDQMQSAKGTHFIYAKVQAVHDIPRAEKQQLALGHAVRHVLKEQKLEDIASVQLRKKAPTQAEHPAQAEHVVIAELSQEQAQAIAEMSDEEFEGVLAGLHERQPQAAEAKPQQPRSMPEVFEEQSKSIAAALRKSGLSPASTPEKIKEMGKDHLALKLALRMAALIIYENVLSQRRADVEREKAKQIEKKELHREILKSEILKDSVSKETMKQSIIKALEQEFREERQSSKQDWKLVGEVLTDLVWGAMSNTSKAAQGS